MKTFRMLIQSGLSMMLLLATTTLFTGHAHAQFSSPVHEVNNPAFQPFQADGFAQVQPNADAVVILGTSVPSGKRLVLEYVSGDTNAPNNGISIGSLTSAVNQHFIPVSFGSSSIGLFSQPVRLYLDEGDTLSATILGLQTSGVRFFQVFATGYFVNKQ